MQTPSNAKTTSNKRLSLLLISSAALLCLPLIAMQFTSQVNWNLADFLVAGLLLLATSFGVEWALRKLKTRQHRLLACLAIVLVAMLVWAELAVGIFGSPLAGS
ncbi:MAG TPA: hypothetical protein PKD90_11440 [Phnomibacter sp.]|nr:hypothetical protein [Phnomibacter sp.]